MRRATLAAIIVTMVLLTSGCTLPWQDEPVKPRKEMRDLVRSISATARETDADFIVITQNGLELLTKNGRPDGKVETGYLDAIDGVAQEDLFYGWGGMDRPTPVSEMERLSALLNVSLANGKVAMVTDYCSLQGYVWDSMSRNSALGFVPFAADSLELDRVPVYPAQPVNVNQDDVSTLGDVNNFLYLIDPGSFESRDAYLDALRSTRFDLLVIDLFYNGTPLTIEEVGSLKVKRDGGTRLVICYMSIGEAEDYRYYWGLGWEQDGPSWLGRENPEWEGNYQVEYWDKGWKQILYKSENSYLSKVLKAGFDGVFLGQVGAYEYFE